MPTDTSWNCSRSGAITLDPACPDRASTLVKDENGNGQGRYDVLSIELRNACAFNSADRPRILSASSSRSWTRGANGLTWSRDMLGTRLARRRQCASATRALNLG